MTAITKQVVQKAIDEYIAGLQPSLRELNLKLAYKEYQAHDVLCEFLESQGIPTDRHAYGLKTAFESRVGDPAGRCVNFNAEYDALPGIGHACGHNLIATASVTAFLALAFAIQRFNLPGQAQLLGTPAEEEGGGKIDLIRAGAYEKADVSLMIAHAAVSPWEGINALDAVVAAYNNISMLRQQLRPDERVHGAILQAPSITNAIPELTRTRYTIRSRTMERTRQLGTRVRQCLEAGALATGCKIELEEDQIYGDLVVNPPLCKGFAECMEDQGVTVLATHEDLMAGSTDQGNVSQIMPALHAVVGIPVSNGAKNHTRDFTAAAAGDKAHRRTVLAGKAMAMTGWRILVDEEFYQDVKGAFSVTKGVSL
ncbi:unnamed protein product [Aspergillus oryzae]|uniref:Peptidase M20 domain-containing protein 2 n=2 Tax=Aspergillus oryzae TaxID=5062 RepID=A0AAN4YDM9_ASPOZ|nr:unnamed protein product [Aspergillus oryzae]GMF88021.1 unnamed protein product [Aspergillus oryzae]GMG06524.1 unnamed protein product [Aspergillus oryzae]GMG24364.1 unnamed protein product [Aspergillus oryzae]GMG47639.1 unnamed protein product [Aspergillus oryzae var. brunneus]